MKPGAKTSLRMLLLICLSLFLLYSPTRAHAQLFGKKKGADKADSSKAHPAPYTGVKHRIAVADISDQNMQSLEDGQIAPPANFASGLTDLLTTSLVQCGHFNVFERAKLDAVKSELVLDNSGLVTADSAAKIGKLEGVEYLITGAITEYSNKKGSGGVSFGGISVGNKGGSATLGLDLRVIDVTTGAVAFVVHAEGKNGSSGAGVSYVDSNISFDGKNYSDSALGKAIRDGMNHAVDSLCDQFEHVQGPAWQGEVADVDLVGGKPSVIYIGSKDLSGLKEGDQLEILVPGKEIKNKAGEVLGHKPSQHIATCRVTGIKEKLATATLTEVGDFSKEDIETYIVQRVSPPASSSNQTAQPAGTDDKSSTSGGKP